MKRQYLHELHRRGQRASVIIASSCTLSRLDHLLTVANGRAGMQAEIDAGALLLSSWQNRRIRESLAALWNNDDAATTQTADAFLNRVTACRLRSWEQA